MGKIGGNTEGVRNSCLLYLEGFLDNIYSPGEYIPKEIQEMLLSATCDTGREVAVYLDRRNRVLAINIGDSSTVTLPEMDSGRRGEKRLSGIRLWHTHPNASPIPSDVDINSLKTLRLDAMGVVAVNLEKKCISGFSATILNRNKDTGMLTEPVIVGPYTGIFGSRFNILFDEIERIDAEASEYSAETLEEGPERAILVGAILPGNDEANPLEELKLLAESAGAVVVGKVTQKRQTPDARYYVGKGVVEDLALKCQALSADLLIFDDELTASTVRNIENAANVRVIDRTTLILDIFAKRAKSKEGRLQVELAQQKYRLPRLYGQGSKLSRLGGGIGTRGPGETKLVADRNHIMRRITYLEDQLKEVASRRNVMRKDRTKKGVPVIAVVGYTNAGKSSLVNRLCNSDVFAEDMLFATLDPSVRKLVTDEKQDFLMVDTVGFVRKLPHDLVEAFKSTLEEVTYADLLVHVVDGSSPDADAMIAVVESIEKELGAENKVQFLVVNKTDLIEEGRTANVSKTLPKTFYTSVKTGEGIDELRDAITGYFTSTDRLNDEVVPYTDGKKLASIHAGAVIISEEYEAEGVHIVYRTKY